MHCQRTGDGHPLLLSAGKRFGVAPRRLFHSDGFQQLVCFVFRFLSCHAQHMCGGFDDVSQHGQMREQIQMLKDGPDFPSQLFDPARVFMFRKIRIKADPVTLD